MRLHNLSKMIYLFIIFQSCKDNIYVESTYYDNGKIKTEITYKDSMKFGKAKFYHSNGLIKDEFNYVNNKIEGNYFSYDEEGFVTFKGQFVNGYAVGPLYYYKKGKTLLYNERNFAGDIYFVRKYDSINHELIKEEGVCVNIDTNVYRLLNLDKQKYFGFFYSRPNKCINELNCSINGIPVSFDTLKGHIVIVKVNKINNEFKTLKIISKLIAVDENRVVCYDSTVTFF